MKTYNQILIILFIIIGLPIIIPVGLIIFWVRCGRNMADHMDTILNEPDEPVAMVEGLDQKEYARLMHEAGELIKYSNEVRKDLLDKQSNHDKF
jgi:hypothetical protein